MKSNIADMNTPIPVCLPISDAVTLYALQTHRFKTARLSIYTITPADAYISPLETLLFGIFRRGSEKYPSLALLNHRLDDLYGTTLTLRNFLRGDDHVLSFTAEMMADVYALEGDHPHILGGTMELMAEMLLHPLRDEEGFLPAAMVEAEKKALIDSLESEINEPRSYAATRLRQITCEGEPFGLSLSGSIPMIAEVTPETVTQLMNRWLADAHWEIYYVGCEFPETVAATFQQVFADFNPTPLQLTKPHAHQPSDSPKRVDESFPVGQGRLCISWSLGVTDTTPICHGQDNYAAAVILCELLGIMQSSLLFRYVREELGLCYDCDAAFEGKKGILSVTLGVHPQNREAAEQAIFTIFSDLQQGRLSQENIDLAKISLKNSYNQLPDSPAAMESYWFWHDSQQPVPPEEHLKRFLAVTFDDVIRVARKFTLDTVYFLNATNADGEVAEDD